MMINSILGMSMQQQQGVIQLFSNILEENKPDRIVELGTGRGGLSVLLALYAYNTVCAFYTFDVNYRKLLPSILNLLCNLGASVGIKDSFKHTNYIEEIIIRPGKTLLLCDNGNKKLEFETFAPLLKFGDLIMVHDYYYTKELFNKKFDHSVCCEIEFDDIRSFIVDGIIKERNIEDNFLWGFFERC